MFDTNKDGFIDLNELKKVRLKIEFILLLSFQGVI